MKTLSLVLATIFVGSALVAQQPRGPRGGRGGPDGPGGLGMNGGLDGGLMNGPNAERRLTRALSLNSQQQNQLHTVLEEEKVTAKGLAEKTQDLRQQLGEAIRAGDEGKIDQVSRDLGQVTQQRQAITAKTLARFYKTLDASQKGTMERVLGPQLGLRRQRPNPPAVQ